MKKLQAYTKKIEADLLYNGVKLKEYGTESDGEITIHKIIKYKNRIFEYDFAPNYNYTCIYLFELLKKADITATEQKEVITYKTDGNSVKTCRKGLVSLAKIFNDKSIIGLYAEPIQADFSDDIKSVIIYRDFAPCN